MEVIKQLFMQAAFKTTLTNGDGKSRLQSERG